MVNINTECVAMVSVYQYIDLGKCVVAELKKKSITKLLPFKSLTIVVNLIFNVCFILYRSQIR